MTALQPLLAIVTLLLCFCGTLAGQTEQSTWVPKGKMQSAEEDDLRQVDNVPLKRNDQLIDALDKKKPKEELEIELKTLIPILESSYLYAKKLWVKTPSMSAEELAKNLKFIKDSLRPAVGGNNQAVPATVTPALKNAKDKLQGIVKDLSSTKVVQAVTSHPITDEQKPGVPKGKMQTQLPSATAEELLKEVDSRQVGNVALKGKDQLIDVLNKKKTKEELEIELKTLIPKLESSFHNAKNLLDNTPSMSAEELATNLKPIKDTLRPAVGGYNQIVVGVKKAKDNFLDIVKDPSSIKDYKIVQAVTSQPIIDEVINLLVNTPSMSIEELAKNLKTIKDTLRPAVGGDNQIVAGVKAKENLLGIVEDPSSINDYKVIQDTDEVVNQPITQDFTGKMLPWLGRWFRKGPAKVVM